MGNHDCCTDSKQDEERPYQILRGDCLELLKNMADNSIDSIVTDPPYHLTTGKKGGTGPASLNEKSPAGRARISTGFMGQAWDGGDIAFRVEVWRECLRVLKPGGHLLAFSGSRTYHRMACAIEDAGFEMRDMIAWVYSTGFPKSLDVSKAIDKRGGNAHLTAEIGAAIKAARVARGISIKEADARYCGGSTLWTWYEGRPAGQQLPTSDVMKLIALDWPELEQYAEAIVEAEREVVAQQRGTMLSVAPGQNNDRSATMLDITTPVTDAARQWSGWGTALKPAHEPICMARKPLVGTVAANVLQHGTGALNIDGCRVEGSPEPTRFDPAKHGHEGWRMNATGAECAENASPLGRWPANLIHDGSAEVVALFPQSSVTGKRTESSKAATVEATTWLTNNHESTEYTDSGSAARFFKQCEYDAEDIEAATLFYCAKASRRDRNEGLLIGSTPAVAANATMSDVEHADWSKRNGNFHPTVKPTDLCRWLLRLVTPPGGTSLDIFCGSGSFGKAAMLKGFSWIGMDLDSDENGDPLGYLDITRARVEHAYKSVHEKKQEPESEERSAQMLLFSEAL